MDWDRDKFRDQLRTSIREGTSRCDRGYHGGVIWGAVVCGVGVILLLDHMGIISAERLWRFWPMFIVVAGVVSILQASNRAWGALLIVIGLLFQLSSVGIIRFRWSDLWPLAIIAAGAMMIWGSLESRRARARVSSSGDAPAATMNITAIFGGIERHVTAHDFRGGTVSAVFGGAELDFREAEMEGEEAVLEVNAVFGGAEIRVPTNWRVEVRGQALFGGYSDSTRSSVTPDVNAPKRKTLILTGTALFGGVELKN